MTYCDNETDFTLLDDGTMDTVIECDVCAIEMRFSDASYYRGDDGTLDIDALVLGEDMEHETPDAWNE